MSDRLFSAELAGAIARYRRQTSRFVRADHVDVHVVEEGAMGVAPTIVLLSAQWLGVSHGDRWAEHLTGTHRVVRVDLPGQGLSGRFPDGDYAPVQYARLIDAVLRALDIGAHIVVGTSFSGIAAALYAADHPNGLRGVVLATSSGLPRAPGGPSPGALPDDAALAAIDGRFPRGFYAWKLASLLRRPLDAATFDALVEEMWVLNELPGRADEARARVARHDPTALAVALREIRVPLLVQWSSHSTYLPPEMAEQIAALAPHVAALHHYSETGHLLLTDAPTETAHDVAAFVETLR